MPISNTYLNEDSLKQSLLEDTIYGVENEELIPVRQPEVILQKELVTEKLFDPTLISSKTDMWQIVVLLLSVVLIGMVKAFSNNRYKLGLKALISYSVAQEITREEQVFFHRSNIFLTIAHVLTFSLLVLRVKTLTHILESNFKEFVIIVVGISLIYLVKYISARLLLFVFNNTITVSEYVFNVSLYNNLLGVILVPILCASYFTSLSFSDLMIYAVTPLALLVFILRLIRLFAIGRSIGLFYVYIFLYICTLEILPLVVLYRIFIRY